MNEVILGDVLGSFAFESCLMPLALVPIIGLFLMAPLPDWGYEADDLRERMRRWYRVPRWRHYLNPVRVVGYPLAFLLSLMLRRRLKAAYAARA